MTAFFGTHGIINPLTLLVGAVMFLVGAILRKQINDFIDMNFSVILATGVGVLSYILLDNIFHIMKLSIGLSVVLWIAGGFLGGFIMPDGQSSGEGGESDGGSYEE
jgi:hypothetical protein